VSRLGRQDIADSVWEGAVSSKPEHRLGFRTHLHHQTRLDGSIRHHALKEVHAVILASLEYVIVEIREGSPGERMTVEDREAKLLQGLN